MNYLLDLNNFYVVVVAMLTVSMAIGLHFEILSRCNQYLPVVARTRRYRVLALIFFILLAHVVEIWVFACGYYVLAGFEGTGELSGIEGHLLAEYVYFSAMVFTTVGFGDVLPHGPIRFLSGMEALTGLVLITWSASYTFLEMQRDWPGRGER